MSPNPNDDSLFRALVTHSADLTMIVDDETIIRYASPAVAAAFGLAAESFLGRALLDLLAAEDVAAARGVLDSLPVGESTRPIEWTFRLPSGAVRTLETIATNLLGDAIVGGIVLTARDVTARKAVQVDLARRVVHDVLTGLSNRGAFVEQVVEAQARDRRDGGRSAVVLVDVDDFRTVNDSLGHTAGDELLVAIARRMRTLLQPNERLGRLGGDEFAVLLPGSASLEAATDLARRLLAACRLPVLIGEDEIFVRLSMGVSISRAGQGADELLREADVALYAAKARGKGCIEVFDSVMDASAHERLHTELELRRALSQGELRVFYQTIVSLSDRSVSGLEALARWQHPHRGLVSPADFIPLAEETGLIVPIGQWVIEQACQHIRFWRDRYPSLGPLVVSVNLSARQFQRDDLVLEIMRAVRQEGVEPSALKLEITESTVMRDPERAATTLRELKALGFQLAIDDFGTGYSSLSYLKLFPVDTLKIDRSFVETLGADSQDTAIVRSVVELAQALDVSVTGEGIETAIQANELRAMGCHGGQGYLFSRPLPSSAVTVLLDELTTPDQDAETAPTRGVA